MSKVMIGLAFGGILSFAAMPPRIQNTPASPPAASQPLESPNQPTPAPEPSPQIVDLAQYFSDRPTRPGNGGLDPDPQPLDSVPVGHPVVDAAVCVNGPKGGERVCASGVSIDPALAGVDPSEGSVVLTNAHVVVPEPNGAGRTPPIQLFTDLVNGDGENWHQSELIKESRELDLAVLLVPGANFPIAPLAEKSPDGPAEGFAIGFPLNRAWIQPTPIRGKHGNCLAQSPCLGLEQGSIVNGSSGSPLAVGNEVVGINEGETDMEIAIPVEHIHDFLSGESETGAPSQMPPGMPPGMPPDGPQRGRSPRF